MRIFNRCIESGVVPEDWNVACITLIYKGKGDKIKRPNYSGIITLNIPGKIYGRV